MDAAAAAGIAVALLLVSMALFHISGNIARLAKAMEAKKGDPPKVQV